jgi:hypothetical protein
MKFISKIKQGWNWAFGTKYDAGISLMFIGLGLLGGGIATLFGAPWWLTLIATIGTPLAFYWLCVLFFMIIFISFIGG